MVNEGTVDPTGTPWTDREIDLIVADYFAMLNSELHAQVYVKADNNRNMQQQTGRQRGAIEYKHQNISAVLSQLGFPWISGYKPAWNFQASLITGIERYLENSREDSLLKLLAISDAKEDLIEISGAGFIKDEEVVIPIKQMPDASTKSEANTPELERLVRKFDPSARDAHNRRLGKQGEEKVFYSEQARLWEIGCKDLARRVRWVSEEDGDGAGYDILSFNALGEERFLEVKTTTGHARIPFYISKNERNFADENPDRFRIFRLYNFLRAPEAFKLRPPLKDNLILKPTNYLASLR